MYVLLNREFPKLFTENRVQTVTHVTWNGPSDVWERMLSNEGDQQE